MHNSDDEKFEEFLKQFRPLVAQPLPMARQSTRKINWISALAAIVAIVTLASVGVFLRPKEPSPNVGQTVMLIAHSTGSQPLTLGAAKTLLNRSASIKATLDREAFRPAPIQFSDGAQSALAILSQERTKL